MPQPIVVDDGDLRRYRTEIPNLIDDLDLSVYAYRLYGHLKRVAGDSGRCFQGVRKIAELCKISPTSVVNAKHELVARGLITITPGDPSANSPDIIHITNIWRRNFIHFLPPGGEGLPPEHPVPVVEHPVPVVEHPVPVVEHPVPVVEHKKEPIKKEPIEEEITGSPNGSPSRTRASAARRGERIPEPFTVTEEMKTWAAEHTPGVDVDWYTDEFVDYWKARAGRDACKLDWQATWKNRMRAVFERQGGKNGQQPVRYESERDRQRRVNREYIDAARARLAQSGCYDDAGIPRPVR